MVKTYSIKVEELLNEYGETFTRILISRGKDKFSTFIKKNITEVINDIKNLFTNKNPKNETQLDTSDE